MCLPSAGAVTGQGSKSSTCQVPFDDRAWVKASFLWVSFLMMCCTGSSVPCVLIVRPQLFLSYLGQSTGTLQRLENISDNTPDKSISVTWLSCRETGEGLVFWWYSRLWGTYATHFRGSFLRIISFHFGRTATAVSPCRLQSSEGSQNLGVGENFNHSQWCANEF